MMKMLAYTNIAAAGLLLTTTAFAGWKVNYPVWISHYHFQGSFGSVRNSVDNIQYIYCQDRGTDAVCSARDSNYNTVGCSTNNLILLDVIRGMDDSSFIKVYYKGGTCSRIEAFNTSAAGPKL
jgi:hypothetical protein